MKVLIVDDKEEARYFLETLLKGNGYGTITATNGKEALDILDTEYVDLIISDALMPVMDGFEFCRRCKTSEKTKNIPFVFCTATYLDEKDRRLGLQLGADEYITKPIEPDVLLEIVKKVIESVRTGRPEGQAFTPTRETATLKLYNEVLIHKLEQKVSELEEELKYRQQLEEELSRSEENFRNSLNNSPLGYSVITEDFNVLYANKACLEIFGLEEVGDLNTEPEYTRLIRESLYSMLLEKEDGAVFHQEIEIIRKDGKKRCVELFYRLVSWNGSKQKLLIFHDITNLKKAEKEAKANLQKLEELLKGVIGIIAFITELKDPYTAGHQKRVAQLAQAIAHEMNLENDRVTAIFTAGLLHDVGKIRVPSEILSKSGRLSEFEFALVKVHPDAGYDILKNINFTYPIEKWVKQHHERLNGSGYPEGLKGEEICLESRILAVADVVEAMVSHRPYRPAHSLGEALDEISRNRDTLYDPLVADICIKLFYEKGFRFDSEQAV